MGEEYPLQASEDGTIFTTSAGIVYALLFRAQQESLFPKLPQLHHHIFSCSFFPLADNDDRLPADRRVMPTIVKAIQDKFYDRQSIMLFIVDDSDNRQDARWRMFKRLYAAADPTGIRLLHSPITKGPKIVMSALLVHDANIFKSELTTQFYELATSFGKA